MGERIPFDKTPKYLGVTLDFILSYHEHLANTTAKVSKLCNLLKKLANNHYGADFTTLRTSKFALFCPVAEYCCPIWSQSYHCQNVDVSLNEYLRLVSGCIKSTPTAMLPILSGIEPMDIRRYKNILIHRISAMENTQIFPQAAISPLTNGKLKSRMLLSTCIHRLSHGIDDISPDTWAQHT